MISKLIQTESNFHRIVLASISWTITNQVIPDFFVPIKLDIAT
jgi:hypothetical protein